MVVRSACRYVSVKGQQHRDSVTGRLNFVLGRLIFLTYLLQGFSLSPPPVGAKLPISLNTSSRINSSDRDGVYRSLKNCGSWVWNLPHVAILVHTIIIIRRWVLDFWKICWFLLNITHWGSPIIHVTHGETGDGVVRGHTHQLLQKVGRDKVGDLAEEITFQKKK